MRVILLCNEYSFESYENKRMIEEGLKLGLTCEAIKYTDLRLVLTQHEAKVMYKNEALEGNLILARCGQIPGSPYLSMLEVLEETNHVINGSFTVDLASNKCNTLKLFAQHNLPIVDSIIYNDIKSHVGDFSIPFVIKPLCGSLGYGIELVSSDRQVEKMEGPLITQRFISESSGTDVRIVMFEDTFIAAMKRSNEHDFRANVALGGDVSKFEVDEETMALCRKIMKTSKATILGIDLLFENEGFKICEINSAPGFTGLESANPDANVAGHFMKLAYEHYQKHNQ